MPTTTINYSAQDGGRIAAAVGAELDLGRSATANEVKTYVMKRIEAMVLRHERQQKQAALTDDPIELT